MSLVDNRVQIQDCEAAADVSGDTTAAPTGASSVVGTVIQGTNSTEFQVADAQEVLLFDQDSASATFNVDMSDMTIYMAIKYNLGELFGNVGGLIAFGDGADGAGGDIVGYSVTGADVAGFPYELLFSVMKLDVSVVVASPGTAGVDHYVYNGVEANLDHTAVLQIGYGSFGLVKAVSTAKNAWCDGIYYIANDSIALSIIGGTVGTPETMVDAAADDVTSGIGMINNPKGTEYGFFAPTEWGAATGDTYFTSEGEQWYFIGDNQGGHALGATHFPMQLLGGTGTNSWVITSTVMVNTGTRSQFDLSHASFDTATMDGCSMIGFDTIELPNATTKTTLNCVFSDCGIITSNGGDMTGSSILTPAVAANEAGLVWNQNADTDGALDDMTFTKTSGVLHHAIEFGTGIPTVSITLRGCAFGTDFSASENTSPTAEGGSETFAFRDTTGTLTVNLVSCTGNFGYYSAGVVITIVADPATTKLTTADAGGTLIENARVFLETADAGATSSGLPYQDAVTSLTQAAGTATLTSTLVHGLVTGDKVVVRGAAEQPYNSVVSITVTTTTAFEYAIDSGATSPAGGTPIFSYVPIQGLTDVSGEITSSKVWPEAQSLKGYARKSTASPFYVQTAISIADGSGGTDLLVALQSDE